MMALSTRMQNRHTLTPKMSTRLGKLSFFFIIAFLVLLFVGASKARYLYRQPIITADQIQINHNQIEEYVEPTNENAKSAAYYVDLINQNTKSAYHAYLHTKRLNIFGTEWLWRIDVLLLLLCLSFFVTDLSSRVFFCIASRCSAKVSKSI
ncbi:hypothetical protein [Arabidopsis thaliana]|uniref:Uncharacterized protein AT4g30050 n=4 Tax=Arabidopsis TaxID=3701 RepID=Q9SZV8_ARATH|nr:hypothetical protein [Arabidopsis thaliana]CAB80998.1 hypothetical protein [Arabidopsis thaliana]